MNYLYLDQEKKKDDTISVPGPEEETRRYIICTWTRRRNMKT